MSIGCPEHTHCPFGAVFPSSVLIWVLHSCVSDSSETHLLVPWLKQYALDGITPTDLSKTDWELKCLAEGRIHSVLLFRNSYLLSAIRINLLVLKTRKGLERVAATLFWTSALFFLSLLYSVVLQDAWNLLVYTSKLLADLVILIKSRGNIFWYFQWSVRIFSEET